MEEIGPPRAAARCRNVRLVHPDDAEILGHGVWRSRGYEDSFEEALLVERLCWRRCSLCCKQQQCVYWAPWVIQAPSKLLQNRGLKGWGLYAARTFRKGDVIGWYSGRRIPSADSSFPSALAARVAAAFYLRGLADGPDKELSRSMSQIQRHGDDYWVIDGSHGSEPFCQMINSPAGGDAPNLRLLPNGVLEVIARQIAPLSELLFEYGEWYRFDRKDEQSCEDSVL